MFSVTEHVPRGVGPVIRDIRRRRGFTLRALAAELDVSVGTMSAIENDKVAMTLGRLRALAAVLQVAVADLADPLVEPGRRPSAPSAAEAHWRVFEPLELDPVLQAALDVFAETGYHGATMRVLAAAADLSVASIYRYHRSKERVLVALVDAQLDDLQWRIDAAAGGVPSPAAAFAQMVQALVLAHVHRRDLSFIVETELRSLQEPDRSRIAAARRAVPRALVGAATAAVAAGEFSTGSPEATAHAVVSLCRAVPFRYDGVQPFDSAAIAAEYADLAAAMMGQ